MQPKSLLAVAAVLLMFSTDCGQQRLKVIHMPEPDYPYAGCSQGIEGSVLVNVGIGTDGKVEYARGTGDSMVCTCIPSRTACWQAGDSLRSRLRLPSFCGVNTWTTQTRQTATGVRCS